MDTVFKLTSVLLETTFSRVVTACSALSMSNSNKKSLFADTNEILENFLRISEVEMDVI